MITVFHTAQKQTRSRRRRVLNEVTMRNWNVSADTKPLFLTTAHFGVGEGEIDFCLFICNSLFFNICLCLNQNIKIGCNRMPASRVK